MRLTQESEYALAGLVFLAAYPRGTAVPLATIARAQHLPSSFLAKTFQKLARHGVLTARRGPGRGYALARDPAALKVREIVEAIEGSDVFQRCLFWPGYCGNRTPCPLHHHFVKLRPAIESLLDAVTLAVYGPLRHGPSPAERGGPRASPEERV